MIGDRRRDVVVIAQSDYVDMWVRDDQIRDAAAVLGLAAARPMPDLRFTGTLETIEVRATDDGGIAIGATVRYNGRPTVADARITVEEALNLAASLRIASEATQPQLFDAEPAAPQPRDVPLFGNGATNTQHEVMT